MEITNEQYNRIQDYLDGKMTEEQQQQFLQELNNNAELRESFSFEMELREDLESIQVKKEMLELQEGLANDPAVTAHIKSLIDEAGQKWQSYGQKKIKKADKFFMKPRTYFMAAAVLIAVACLIFIYVLPGNKSEAYGRLYEKHFTKDALPATVPQMLAQALAGYAKSDYASLLQYDLQNLPNLKGNNDQKQAVLELGYYYKGIAYLAINKYDSARYCLQWVIDSGEEAMLKRKAQWYLALLYVKKGEKDNALKLLQGLAVDPAAGDLQHSASVLADELRTNKHFNLIE